MTPVKPCPECGGSGRCHGPCGDCHGKCHTCFGASASAGLGASARGARSAAGKEGLWKRIDEDLAWYRRNPPKDDDWAKGYRAGLLAAEEWLNQRRSLISSPVTR